MHAFMFITANETYYIAIADVSSMDIAIHNIKAKLHIASI